MKTDFKNIFKQTSQGNLGQLSQPKQQQANNENQEKEQKGSQAMGNTSEDNGLGNLIADLLKNHSGILLGIAGAGLVYFIIQLLNDKNKLSEQNMKLQKDFKSFRNETQSAIIGLKRELKKKGPKSNKRFEDVFDVTDIEGSYVIETDEKPEEEKTSLSELSREINIGFIG